ncbi:hypothetical protein T4A_9540 [Trichinella pseudospiralis]|uniref:Uncharacterized protein n=1 Tax=Trichinella pseudospiralis TaxID=6337 RepID=A0A0V1E7K6_TRIPS|nr:hypothetical protein T4A_9540 [Trichinella pseudospiralis]
MSTKLYILLVALADVHDNILQQRFLFHKSSFQYRFNETHWNSRQKTQSSYQDSICRLCDVGTTKFCCSSTVAVVNVKRSNFPGLQIEGIRCIDIAKERKVGAVQLFLRSTELYAEHCW